MDSSNNTVNQILDSENWSNNLLVKDEKGNLAPLKKTEIKPSTNNSNLVSGGKLAPDNDSFESMQDISGSSQDKSELIFHPDDKAELEFLAKNVPQDDSKKYSVEKIVARIIEKQDLSFDDKNKKIFTNILYNFFRSRKSAVITRDLLKNNVLMNGKALSEGNVDTILSVVKSIKGRIESEGGLVVNQADLQAQKKPSTEQKVAAESQKDLEENLKETEAQSDNLSAQDEIQAMLSSQLETEPKEEIKEESKQLEPVEKEDAPANDKSKQPDEGFAIPSGQEQKAEVSIAKPIVSQQIEKNETSDKKEKVQTEPVTSLPKVSRPGAFQNPKKSINDVVKPAKDAQFSTSSSSSSSPLTGPVQELGSFDLVGFRRLGESADERVSKILDKINLLEQESYTKKAEGIAAWRKSGAYQLYLQIGAASMVEGKKVEDYIKEKEDQNEDTLSFTEFSAISDLNKQLRF